MADTKKAAFEVHQAELDMLDPRYVGEATGVAETQQKLLRLPADSAVPGVARRLQ